MTNTVENIAERVTSSLGAKVNYGEKVRLETGESMPVSVIWFGFGGGNSEGAEGSGGGQPAGSGGGGGGASIPVGVYVGSPQGARFVPNLIALLGVSIPLMYVTGKAFSRIIRALKK